MDKLKVEEFCTSGVFRRDEFENKLKEFDWSRFKDKGVLIEGCSTMLLPHWAFMIITAKLVPCARIIMYGEPSNPIIIYKKD